MIAAATGSTRSFDVVLAGGGLASGLAVMALRRRWPLLRIGLVEAGESLGGNHTWSFFESDVDDDGARLLAPLVVHRYPRVSVAFPDHERQLGTRYASITSPALHQAVAPLLSGEGSQLALGRRAVAVTPTGVSFADGDRWTAPLVLDGRGPVPQAAHYENQGFQKFVGLEVELATSGTLDPNAAVIMDARVPQTDGYRFVYVLPLGLGRVLVEDTYYSDSPTLDRPVLRARIEHYLATFGARIARVVREESGVLPLPWSDDSVPPLGSPVRLGARGGWFHPTTGYTVPLAVRVAQALEVHGIAGALPALGRLYRELESSARFARRLNRLLFRAVAPDDRWQILSRFYRLPTPSIERFYALQSTRWDRARILIGRPPRGVSLRAAFSSLATV